MIMLELDEVLEIHKMLINATGGSHGIRDIELLKSALENAFQTFEILYKECILCLKQGIHSLFLFNLLGKI
jgi:prophage maintenance system killer protein